MSSESFDFSPLCRGLAAAAPGTAVSSTSRRQQDPDRLPLDGMDADAKRF